MLKDMPKNEGGGVTGKNQHGFYATSTKTEPVPKEQLPTYAELNINKKGILSKFQGKTETKNP